MAGHGIGDRAARTLPPSRLASHASSVGGEDSMTRYIVRRLGYSLFSLFSCR